MGQTIPTLESYLIGGAGTTATRRAVSFTPEDDMTLRQFSFVGVRKQALDIGWPSVPGRAEVNVLEWEIRTADGDTHKPGTDADSILANGDFDYRYTSSWKLNRPLKYTVNLPSSIELEGGEEYFFIIKMPSDESTAKYPFAWFTTYETGAAEEVDSDVYSALYNGSWAATSNSYNLTLYILDEQAGQDWHIVLDGNGYMQPDNMRGYRCEQVASGLAATRGGQSEHSQLRYPYSNLSQDSWIGGSGQLDQDDETAFLYSLGLDTLVPHQMTIGPYVHMTGAASSNPHYEATAITVRTIPDSEFGTVSQTARYVAQQFTSPAGGMTATSVGVRLNRQPWQRNQRVWVAIYTDSAGEPDTNVSGWALLNSSFRLRWQDGAMNVALPSPAPYWVVVCSEQTTGNLPEHRLMYDQGGSYANGVAKYSLDGAAWEDITGHSLIFRVNEGSYVSLDGDVVAMAYGDISEDLTGNAFNSKLVSVAGKGVYEWNETEQEWTCVSDETASGSFYGPIMGEGTTELEENGTDVVFFNDYLLVAQGLNAPIRAAYDYMGVPLNPYWVPFPTPSLVTNGTFDSDTSGWTAGNSATLSSENGGLLSTNCLKILNTTTSQGYAYQEISVTPGEWYDIELNHMDGSSLVGVEVRIGTTITGGEYIDTDELLSPGDWSRKMYTVQATSDTMYITLLVYSTTDTEYAYFENVKVQWAPCAKYFHIGKGYLWAVTGNNEVKHTSDLASWSSAITVGESMYEITDMVGYQGKLLVGKEDGIWEIDDDDLSLEYLLFREHAHPDNCRGWAVWSGMLFIPVQSTVWRWQGSQYKDIGPTDKMAGPTSEWPNRISRMTPTAPYLLATAEPVPSGGWGGLMAYNGTGWHHITEATAHSQASDVVFVTTEVGTDETRIWFGEGRKIAYVTFPTYTSNRYDWDNADYEPLGAGFISSWWDGGVKDARKFWNRMTVLADIPEGCSIEAYAARDGESWESTEDFIYLGELFPELLEDTGEYTLMFPDGMVAKSIQPIFNLNTTDSSIAPRIKAFNVEAAVRQPPAYVYTLRIRLANNITKMNSEIEDDRTANDMWEELQRTAAKDAPIIISLPGKTIRGMISHLSESTDRYVPDGAQGEESWERVAVVSVIEAT